MICLRYSHRSARSITTLAYSWGVGTDGELGHPSFQKEATLMGDAYVQVEPRRIIRSKRFKSFAVGSQYTLALDQQGKLYHWGLSHTKKFQSNEPKPLDMEKRFSKIAIGSNHAAAVSEDGEVYTWGRNQGSNWMGISFMGGGGYLGHGDTQSVHLPKRIDFLSKYGAKAADVVCGGRHTVIRTVDGELLSCGVGEYGRLGTGSTVDSLEPAPLETLVEEDIIQIAAGSSHTLALSKSGKLFVWGRNDYGQLGFEDSYMDMYSLEDIPRLLDARAFQDKQIVSIIAARGRSGAITEDGQFFTWGYKSSHMPTLLSPRLLGGLRVVKAAFGGDVMSNSCTALITEDGSLWTYGDAGSHMIGRPLSTGQSGLGRLPEPSKVPVFQGKRVVEIYMGSGQHAIATVEASTTEDSTD